MNLPQPAARAAADILHTHLAPELAAYLAAEGTLPAGVIRAEYARMRTLLVAIASYIPTAVVRQQLAYPAAGRVSGAYWDGSVLFADLSGFTALSARLSALGKQGAEEISAIINRLFAALVEEVHQQRGGLLKFGGDALTAFFDAAELGNNHAMLASRAALAMHARMAEFAALVTPAGTFTLRLRIGVHSGRVFAAQVGSREHIEVIATGHDINRVALAQEIAEPGEVVVSDSTLALLAAAQPGSPLRAAERAAGFHLLSALAESATPAPAPAPGHATSLPNPPNPQLADLVALAERIDALQPYLPRHLPQRFLEPGSTTIGEFRPVTVLFANFFPFSHALDLLSNQPATAAQVLNAYYRRAQEVVHRYGGIVNKVDMYTHGDKLMALFGAPVANEDDPERAARAALDLRQAMAETNRDITLLLAAYQAAPSEPPGQQLQLLQKIGINTGVVFAGKVGSAERHEYTVMGQHVNLAARLMSVATAGQAVVSLSTRRAIARHFELHDLPPARLKGISEPVPLAELGTPLIAPPANPAMTPGTFGRAPLIGRSTEFEQIHTEALNALAGSGRVIALRGDAGTGKSRLIEESLNTLLEQAGKTSDGLPLFFPYLAESQSYEQSTPYATLRELLRQFFNLSMAAPASAAASEVERRVSELVPDLARFTPLLGDLLGLPFGETALTTALAPEQRHDRAQELVEALVLAEAQQQPIIIIADDLQWCDASSLELLTRIARRVPQAPLLLILGYRSDPPLAEPWAELAHCRRIELGELAAEATAGLVRSLLNGEPPAALANLIEKAQNNPFFVEEVVRGLVESGALQNGPRGWQLTRALDEAAVPNSIEGVITARLDRLEERSRDLLQVASVVGRRFPYPVLSGVVPRDDLPEWLQRLMLADLILPEEVERDLAYLFRHALTRDVAYESILYARRRELHRRVAEQIEQIQAGRLDEQLALLARHYLLAEEWPLAFDYHLRAGRQAQARFANREAIALLERALQIAHRQAEQAPTPSTQIVEIYERLGVVHALIGEYDTALDRYEEALWLLKSQPDALPDGLVRLHHHVARVYEKRANFDKAFEWVEQALALAGDSPSDEVARCLLLGAGLHRRQGRYPQALEWGGKALGLAEKLQSRREQAHAYKLLGITYLITGENLRALELLSQSLQLYEQVQDLGGRADAHNDLANVCYELGRLSAARQHYEAGFAIKQAIGDIYGQAMISNNLGNLLKLQGHIDEALVHYQRSLAIFERLDSRYATGVLHMNLGATQILGGNLESAEAHLRRSTELFGQAGAEDFLPELERYLAELHLKRGNLAEARLACELSLANATQLEARAEAGMTQRVLGLVHAQAGDLPAAWQAFQQSLALLREAGSPHEIARTLVALAELAPALGRADAGQAALTEAMPRLREVGALHDLAEAEAVAMRHGYSVALSVKS